MELKPLTAKKSPKIVIVGLGYVGSNFAFALMISGLAREIVLLDVNQDKVSGEYLDLNHGLNFVPPTNIYIGNYQDCENAEVIVITAGANQAPHQKRTDLAAKNAAIFSDIIPKITKYASNNTILLIVTNPVDILSYVAYKISGIPDQQVIGSGTVLDTSRLHYLISKHCAVNPRNVHAYVMGEHGDTEMVAWSCANIGGLKIQEYCAGCPKANQDCGKIECLSSMLESVKNSAYEVIAKKGATCYAISLALVNIVRTIIRDENTILPISRLVNNYYDISDVYLGLPSIVNRQGAQNFMPIPLTQKEAKALQLSAQTLKAMLREIGYA